MIIDKDKNDIDLWDFNSIFNEDDVTIFFLLTYYFDSLNDTDTEICKEFKESLNNSSNKDKIKLIINSISILSSLIRPNDINYKDIEEIEKIKSDEKLLILINKVLNYMINNDFTIFHKYYDSITIIDKIISKITKMLDMLNK